MKRCLSLWLPAWPIERLRRHEPRLVPLGEAFALTEAGAKGIRLSAVNACAQNQGLMPHMRRTDARAIVPALVTRPAEPEFDREALLRLAHWSTRWGPYVNLEGEDGIWIDVTGVAHLFGGERALLNNIQARLSDLGLTARLGLADTFGAAWALAHYAPGNDLLSRIAPQGRTKDALAKLPLSALRLSPHIIQLLKRLGLYRIKDIYDLPRASLKTRFSSRQNTEAVLMRLDQALGEMKEPRTPLNEPPIHEARRAYPEPLISGEGVEAAIHELAFELTGELAALSLGARHLCLTIYRTDASTIRIPVHQHAPGREPEHIIRLFHEKVAHYDAGFGIDLITLGAFDCAEINHTQSRFEAGKAINKRKAINGLVDRFENRLGPGTTWRLSPRESHIPERAQSRTSAASHASRPAPAPWPGHMPPRPPLLLAMPEPITVMAEVPEGPPAQFTWRRTSHRIIRAEGPERIAPEWWREVGQKETCIRDYYRVEGVGGQRYWLYRDGLYDGDASSKEPLWYMHGLFG